MHLLKWLKCFRIDQVYQLPIIKRKQLKNFTGMVKDTLIKLNYFKMKKKIVYIAHPIGGNVEQNLNAIKAIYRDLSLDDKVIPFAPYVTAVESLDDNSQVQRALGFSHNEAIFKSGCVDELLIYRSVVSSGIKTEIEWASEMKIPIKFKS
jgi:hypothetical protein